MTLKKNFLSGAVVGILLFFIPGLFGYTLPGIGLVWRMLPQNDFVRLLSMVIVSAVWSTIVYLIPLLLLHSKFDFKGYGTFIFGAMVFYLISSLLGLSIALSRWNLF